MDHSVSNARSHRRSTSKRLVTSHKIVVPVMGCDCVHVILDFLRESVCKASKATHGHSHGEVLPIDVASRNQIRIGIAGDNFFLTADTVSRRVAISSFVLSVTYRP